MKVLKKGKENQLGWTKKFTCTGEGNHGGGCGAVLLVSEYDVYYTHSYHYDGSHDVYKTFYCPECLVETDIDDFSCDPKGSKLDSTKLRELVELKNLSMCS